MKRKINNKVIWLIIVAAIIISTLFILNVKWPIYKYNDTSQHTRTITVDGINYIEMTETDWRISGYNHMIGFIESLRWGLYVKEQDENRHIIQARYFSFGAVPDHIIFKRGDVDIPNPSAQSIDYCIMRNTDNETVMVENKELIKDLFSQIEECNEKTNSGKGYTIGIIECYMNINDDLMFELNFMKIGDEYVIYIYSKSISLHITDDFGRELEKYFN